MGPAPEGAGNRVASGRPANRVDKGIMRPSGRSCKGRASLFSAVAPNPAKRLGNLRADFFERAAGETQALGSLADCGRLERKRYQPQSLGAQGRIRPREGRAEGGAGGAGSAGHERMLRPLGRIVNARPLTPTVRRVDVEWCHPPRRCPRPSFGTCSG